MSSSLASNASERTSVPPESGAELRTAQPKPSAVRRLVEGDMIDYVKDDLGVMLRAIGELEGIACEHKRAHRLVQLATRSYGAIMMVLVRNDENADFPNYEEPYEDDDAEEEDSIRRLIADMPYLGDEPLVKSAVAVVRGLRPAATQEQIDAILSAFSAPRFRAHSETYWVTTLLNELAYDGVGMFVGACAEDHSTCGDHGDLEYVRMCLADAEKNVDRLLGRAMLIATESGVAVDRKVLCEIGESLRTNLLGAVGTLGTTDPIGSGGEDDTAEAAE
jgi:hypothetical protein